MLKLFLLGISLFLSFNISAQNRFLSGSYILNSDSIRISYSEEEIWTSDSTALVQISENGEELEIKASEESQLILSSQKVQVLSLYGKWVFVNTLVENETISLYETLVSRLVLAKRGDELKTFKDDSFKSDLEGLIDDEVEAQNWVNYHWIQPTNLNKRRSLAISTVQLYNNTKSSSDSLPLPNKVKYQRLMSVRQGLSLDDFTVFVDGVITNFFAKNMAMDIGLSLKYRNFKEESLINSNLTIEESSVNVFGLIMPVGLRYYLSRNVPNISIIGGAEIGLEFLSYEADDESSETRPADIGLYGGLGLSWPINKKNLLGFEIKYASLENFGSFNIAGTFSF